MSGPGDSASMWAKLTQERSPGDADLKQDWAALCAAWTKFHATMERHIAATPTNSPGPTPAADNAFVAQWPNMPPLSTAGGMFPPMPPVVPPNPQPPNPQPPAPQPPAPPVFRQSTAPAPLPAPTPAPPPEALPGKPTEGQLAAREKYVLDSIQSISNTMSVEITRISTLYMSGQMWANQVNSQMATQYNFALGAFQLLRVEASALKDLGKAEALRVLDLFVDDTQKALGIVGNMVSQQRAFEMGISKVWQKTMTEITATQLDINNDTRRAYDAANKSYFSKY